MRRILAIPLLAAFWIGSPAYASTQVPDKRIAAPVAEPRERMVPPRFKDIVSGAENSEPQAAPTKVAEQRGARGGGGSRAGGGGGNRDNGGGNRGGGSISDRNVVRGSGERGERGGGEVRRGNGGDSSTRTVDRMAFVPQRRPALGYAYSPYRRGYVYPAARYDPWLRHSYGWSPIRYAPWGWIYGTSAFAAWGYGYNYAPYYGYGYNGPDPYYDDTSNYYNSSYYNSPTSSFDTGAVRLKVRPRDAQVFVDGSYAGLVSDFDGVFQELKLSPGSHKIEVHMNGFQSAFFDVYIQSGRTLDLREDLKPRP